MIAKSSEQVRSSYVQRQLGFNGRPINNFAVAQCFNLLTKKSAARRRSPDCRLSVDFFCRQSVFAGRPLRKIQMPKPRPTDDRHKISVNRWSDDDRGSLDGLIKDCFN